MNTPDPIGERTLLLVEDEPGVRRLSERILKSAGYRVLSAANGEEAERLFAEHQDSIDLVITDIIMPGFDGSELIRRLRLKQPSLPGIYMSGYTAQNAGWISGRERGLFFVQKPFAASELVRQVHEAIEGSG